MSGIRYDDLSPGCVAVRPVISLDQQQAGELSVCSRRRLEREAGHARDLRQRLFGLLQHPQRPLHRMQRLERMDPGKAGQRSRAFIHPRIIFHGTGTERIKAVVHAVGFLGQFRIMSRQIDLRNFRKAQRFLPQVLLA